ncbi:pilus assembly protein PilX [uncultured Pyramidobacter sp.]|uniref:pilus assembly protein PilX n=1 Tax=uncultured Pyramidobacter sp. TaxID=1623495 RepID=UPI0025862F09|nr:pilus assembly protein PilX [uncultured Pyramidobacter sp.]
MRRLNALLAAALLILLAWHGLAGSFMLLGVNAGTGKIAGWTAMALAALHGAIGLALTVPTLRASRRGALYLRQNARFWAIRFSGAALILLLCLHVGVFGRVRSGQFVLYEFTTLKMLVQVLLAAALALHVLAGIGPLLVSLGVYRYRVWQGDLLLIFSLLLLFFAAALIFYYARWQWL